MRPGDPLTLDETYPERSATVTSDAYIEAIEAAKTPSELVDVLLDLLRDKLAAADALTADPFERESDPYSLTNTTRSGREYRRAKLALDALLPRPSLFTRLRAALVGFLSGRWRG